MNLTTSINMYFLDFSKVFLLSILPGCQCPSLEGGMRTLAKLASAAPSRSRVPLPSQFFSFSIQYVYFLNDLLIYRSHFKLRVKVFIVLVWMLILNFHFHMIFHLPVLQEL